MNFIFILKNLMIKSYLDFFFFASKKIAEKKRKKINASKK